jgi:hypothetical protein
LLLEQATIEHFGKAEDDRRLANEDRKLAAARVQMQEEQDKLERLKHLALWLSAADVTNDHEKIAQARQGHPDSCRWILRKSNFRKWYDQQVVQKPLLWIHGIPGAGQWESSFLSPPFD